MSGAMLFGNINSEIKRNKVEALCPALSNFTFLHRLEGRTWFRKKKSKISCWSISKVGSPPRSSCRSRARRIFSPWSKCQLKPDFWGRGDPLLALCNADQLNLASFVHLLTVSGGQFILCNIDLICEGCCDKPIIFTLPHATVSLLSILMWSVKVPATQKLILGDWIAQWDTTYGAWFFYNINTGRVSGSLLHLSANCGRYFAKSGDTSLVFANTISHHTSCWAWDFSPGELGHQSICFVTYENTQDVTKFSKILSLFKVADSCYILHVSIVQNSQIKYF